MTHKSSHIIIDSVVADLKDHCEKIYSVSPNQSAARLEQTLADAQELQKIIEKEVDD